MHHPRNTLVILTTCLVLVVCTVADVDVTITENFRRLNKTRHEIESNITYWKFYLKSMNNTENANSSSGAFYSTSAMTAENGHVIQEIVRALTKDSSLSDIIQDNHSLELFQAVVGDLCLPELSRLHKNFLSPYRTYDGSYNNMDNPHWGMTGRAQKLLLPVDYHDGIGAARKHGVNGKPLPNPRHISNVIHTPEVENADDKHASVMVMAFGQFLDHDLVLTPTFKGGDNSNLDCCGAATEAFTDPMRACDPIELAHDDPHFSRYNITCMNFVRSAPAVCDNCKPCVRQQINEVSSYIDASQVYGSSIEKSNSLRSFTKGLMKVGKYDNMLPRQKSATCTLTHASQYCLNAGDRRVNVVPNLSLLHLMFVREHNRLATRLQKINPHWNDEKLFQETRRIVIALMQHFTYKEYLPVVIGNAYMETYKIKESNISLTDTYNGTIDPTVSSVFSTAAFRFGHSSIPNFQGCLGNDYSMDFENEIQTTYNDPNMTFTVSQGLTRWLAFRTAKPTDGTFDKGVRDLLFVDKEFKSLDLAAINIHRGRDHGLSPYNRWRRYCGLVPVTVEQFAKNGSEMGHFSQAVADKFRQVYSHPDDIDLFSGAMRETLLEGAQVGPTFACLIGKEFYRLKHGDRFFFEHMMTEGLPKVGFTEDQVKAVKNTKFSKVVCENMKLPIIPGNVFRPHNFISNRMETCTELPELDLLPWKDMESTSGAAMRVCFSNNFKYFLSLLFLSVIFFKK